MRLYETVLVVSACAAAASSHFTWSFHTDMNNIQNFLQDQSDSVRAFFEGQRLNLENAINSRYEEAVKMKESVNNYVDEQQKKFSADIKSYVDNIKESSRKVADTWSYVPTDDTSSRMDNPDIALSVPSIIARNGYRCETHTVVSQGYVLNIHRIPHAKNGKTAPSNTIILQHGLFASSADWILNGPEKALGYVLADAGYDVWMTNIRGNKYSKEHTVYKTDSKAFWNFSWHDVALYDVPNIIDYIRDFKGKDTKITYIGHSMGTTILFAMLTLRPEYNEILSAGFALAPVVYMSDIKSPLKSLASVASNVAYMEMLYGSHEFIPKNSALGRIASSCDADNLDSLVCKNVIFYICGYDESQFNKTLMPTFLAHLGTGTSWKTAVHFAQEVVSGGKFQLFDYGKNYNTELYGTPTPPEYDLSRVTLPISLFWAQNDLLSSETDVMKLYKELPPTTEIYMVPYPEFNHVDYLWAIDAPKLLNDKVLESLQKAFKSKGLLDYLSK